MSFSAFKFPTLKVSLICSYFLPVSTHFSLLFFTSYFLPLTKKYIISLAVTGIHACFISNSSCLGLRFQNGQKLNNC